MFFYIFEFILNHEIYKSVRQYTHYKTNIISAEFKI